MERIKIAFVASTLSVGGSEKVVYEILTRLPRDRFSFSLLLLKEKGKIGEKLFHEGFQVASGLQKSKLDLTVLPRLASRLRKLSPHILFVLDHHNAMFWGRLSSIVAGVPAMVLASHSTGRYGGKRNFNMIDRLLMRATNVIVALSKAHAEYLMRREGSDPKRLHVIENGIDIEKYSEVDQIKVKALRREIGLSPEDRVVIMVAALRPEKAHEVLLESAGRLCKEFSGIRFLIVGDGVRRRELEKLTDSMGLNKCVSFMGERDDIPEMLKISDVLVLPSHPVVETLPLSLLEAMASGVPVVASAVGSIPEVIEDGLTGKLIPPGDSDALADAIKAILGDREKASRMASKAVKLVGERYSVERMVCKYRDLFETLYESACRK